MTDIQIKERPILFKAAMVNAILSGQKTMTRRIVKPQLNYELVGHNGMFGYYAGNEMDGHVLKQEVKCPFGQIGDHLWVRENFSGYNPEPYSDGPNPPRLWPPETPIHYWADGEPKEGDWTILKPSIHMPRIFSRLTLKITNVRVERLQDISEDDALAEGIVEDTVIVGCNCNGGRHTEEMGIRYGHPDSECFEDAVDAFRDLWDSINGRPRKGGADISWDANPFVWVVEFERIAI